MAHTLRTTPSSACWQGRSARPATGTTPRPCAARVLLATAPFSVQPFAPPARVRHHPYRSGAGPRAAQLERGAPPSVPGDRQVATCRGNLEHCPRGRARTRSYHSLDPLHHAQPPVKALPVEGAALEPRRRRARVRLPVVAARPDPVRQVAALPQTPSARGMAGALAPVARCARPACRPIADARRRVAARQPLEQRQAAHRQLGRGDGAL
mmetsp:Transcript_43951/g.138499  ORF Transcript_43951/g.138499 Transcript_43951/m.138499 type:complete len:210 (+) Transcript_43951:154-783(+)